MIFNLKDMKVIHILFTGLLFGRLFSNNWIAAQSENLNVPNTKYYVHHEYDKDGNLLRYDSSVVIIWNSDSVYKELYSLNEDWDVDALNESNAIDSFETEKQDYFRFGFGNDEFLFHSFPQVEDIIKHFDPSFSSSGSDSLYHPIDPDMPFFYFDSTTPWFNDDPEARMHEMERRMEELIHKHWEIFRNFEKMYDDKSLQKPFVPDSLSTHVPQKQPKQNSNSHIINI
jgi:hypothetical protein